MKKYFTDVDLSRSVGNLLRIGVMLSVFTALAGFAKLFSEGFVMPKTFDRVDGAEGKIWQSFWHGLQNFEGQSIIELGILFLILTPLMRIIFALVGYLKEGDKVYVAVSLIVLAIMAVSFVTGFAA